MDYISAEFIAAAKELVLKAIDLIPALVVGGICLVALWKIGKNGRPPVEESEKPSDKAKHVKPPTSEP